MNLESVESAVAETNVSCGGYTAFRAVTPADLDVFEKAMKPIMGVQYKPLSVATQVVAGINYKFVCDMIIISAEPFSAGVAIVTIFESLDKSVEPRVTAIQRLPH